MNRGLDQRRTPRPPRRTACPRPQTLACLSPWITLGRTWLSSMSLQTLRAVNYTWILSRMRRNRTRGLIRRGGGVAREETTESVTPTTRRRSSTELQHWFQIYHCLSKRFCWPKKPDLRSYVAIFVCTYTSGWNVLQEPWPLVVLHVRLNVCARVDVCLWVLTVFPGEMLPSTGRGMYCNAAPTPPSGLHKVQETSKMLYYYFLFFLFIWSAMCLFCSSDFCYTVYTNTTQQSLLHTGKIKVFKKEPFWLFFFVGQRPRKDRLVQFLEKEQEDRDICVVSGEPAESGLWSWLTCRKWSQQQNRFSYVKRSAWPQPHSRLSLSSQFTISLMTWRDLWANLVQISTLTHGWTERNFRTAFRYFSVNLS